MILNGGAELLKDFESASDNSKEALLKRYVRHQATLMVVRQ